jgi:hypothetical protein
MKGRKSAKRVLMGRSEVKKQLKNRGGDGRIILKWNFKKCYLEAWNGLM